MLSACVPSSPAHSPVSQPRAGLQKFFDGLHPIGNTGHRTQLIHKEWPETRPRQDKGGRGNFDFAILDPLQLAEARIDQFAGGHIEAAKIGRAHV